MSARTLTLHHHRELRFVAADDTTGIVTFAADSASAAGKVNHVSYDTITGAIHCDCAGAACGRECWHGDWVVAAWQAQPAMAEARALPSRPSPAVRQEAGAHGRPVPRRLGRTLPLDSVNLVAARCEYRQRRALAAQPLAA